MQSGSALISHVGIKNAGKLPARNISWLISIKSSLNGAEPDFPLEPGKGNIVIDRPRMEDY